MPRTSALECPGCPPLRALTTDILGLIKVVEARGKAGTLNVVETWGPPDASRCIVAASLADRVEDPILAVARKNGLVECLNPLNGDALASVGGSKSESTDGASENDPLVTLHFFKSRRPDSSSMLGSLLTCTEKGKASLKTVAKGKPPSVLDSSSSTEWEVSSAGKVVFSSLNAGESYALFGGKGVEVNLWDLANYSKIWTAKSPKSNSLGIFTPTWFTAGTFLCKDDHRKIAAGTNNHQLRLYDTSSQRRPVISVDFREAAIKAIREDPDGHTIYIGTGAGDLASFDMRTGKLLGCFVGKCSGSIRSIVRHPELPLIASCGLDSYLRIWDTKTRQLLSSVFLKQHLTNVLIDSKFSAEESEETKAKEQNHSQVIEPPDLEGDTELNHDERITKFKKKQEEKSKRKKQRIIEEDGQVDGFVDPDDCNEETQATKRRKSKEERSKSKKIKSKKQTLD